MHLGPSRLICLSFLWGIGVVWGGGGGFSGGIMSDRVKPISLIHKIFQLDFLAKSR